MRILAIETATSACTVAVADGEKVLAELSLEVPRAHSTRLMPLIAQAIQESGLKRTDLELIAVGVGPGSFTGLRIGIATAKGLAEGLGIPAVGVSTLKAIAWGTGAQIGLVVPMLDAKRERVFAAAYLPGDADPNTWAEVLAPEHLTVTELAGRLADLRAGLRHSWQFVTTAGDGASLYGEKLGLGEVLRIAPAGLRLPRASAVAALGLAAYKAGAATDPESLAAIYLRKSEAETLWESRQSS
jgi:tRNA threonylcarbamoyladenosine biosynthesis protein TsaB